MFSKCLIFIFNFQHEDPIKITKINNKIYDRLAFNQANINHKFRALKRTLKQVKKEKKYTQV